MLWLPALFHMYRQSRMHSLPMWKTRQKQTNKEEKKVTEKRSPFWEGKKHNKYKYHNYLREIKIYIVIMKWEQSLQKKQHSEDVKELLEIKIIIGKKPKCSKIITKTHQMLWKAEQRDEVIWNRREKRIKGRILKVQQPDSRVVSLQSEL